MNTDCPSLVEYSTKEVSNPNKSRYESESLERIQIDYLRLFTHFLKKEKKMKNTCSFESI